MSDTSANLRTRWFPIVLAAVAPTVAALLYIHATDSTTVTQIVYFASKALIFAFPLAWWLFIERRTRAVSPDGIGIFDFSSRGFADGENLAQSVRPRELKLTARGDIALGVGSGAIIGVLLWTVYLLWFRDLIDVATLTSRIEQFGVRDNYVPYALFLSIVNSGLEEYYWRWFLFGRLKQKLGMPAAVALSSMAFAAHHFVALQDFLGSAALAGLFSVGIAVGGAIWAYHYYRTGRLWGVWISHCIVDLAALSIGYHLLFRNS